MNHNQQQRDEPRLNKQTSVDFSNVPDAWRADGHNSEPLGGTGKDTQTVWRDYPGLITRETQNPLSRGENLKEISDPTQVLLTGAETKSVRLLDQLDPQEVLFLKARLGESLSFVLDGAVGWTSPDKRCFVCREQKASPLARCCPGDNTPFRRRPIYRNEKDSFVVFTEEDFLVHSYGKSVYANTFTSQLNLRIALCELLGGRGNLSNFSFMFYDMFIGGLIEAGGCSASDILHLFRVRIFVDTVFPRLSTGHGIFEDISGMMAEGFSKVSNGLVRLSQHCTGAMREFFGNVLKTFLVSSFMEGYTFASSMLSQMSAAISKYVHIEAKYLLAASRMMIRAALGAKAPVMIFDFFVELCSLDILKDVAEKMVGNGAETTSLVTLIAYALSTQIPDLAQHVKAMGPFALLFSRMDLMPILNSAGMHMGLSSSLIPAIEVSEEAHNYLNLLLGITTEQKRDPVFQRRVYESFAKWKVAKLRLHVTQLSQLAHFRNELDRLPDWVSVEALESMNKPFGMFVHGKRGMGKSTFCDVVAECILYHCQKEKYVESDAEIGNFYYKMSLAKHQDLANYPSVVRLDDVFTRTEVAGSSESDSVTIMTMLNGSPYAPSMAKVDLKAVTWKLKAVLACSNIAPSGFGQVAKSINNAEAINRRFDIYVKLEAKEGVDVKNGQIQANINDAVDNWKISVFDADDTLLAEGVEFVEFVQTFVFPYLDAYHRPALASNAAKSVLDKLKGLEKGKEKEKEQQPSIFGFAMRAHGHVDDIQMEGLGFDEEFDDSYADNFKQLSLDQQGVNCTYWSSFLYSLGLSDSFVEAENYMVPVFYAGVPAKDAKAMEFATWESQYRGKHSDHISSMTSLCGVLALTGLIGACVGLAYSQSKKVKKEEMETALDIGELGCVMEFGDSKFKIAMVHVKGGRSLKALVPMEYCGHSNFVSVRDSLTVESTLKKYSGAIGENFISREKVLLGTLGAVFSEGRKLTCCTLISSNEAVTVSHSMDIERNVSVFVGGKMYGVKQVYRDVNLDLAYLYLEGTVPVRNNILNKAVTPNLSYAGVGIRVVPAGFVSCKLAPAAYVNYAYKGVDFTPRAFTVDVSSAPGECGQPIFVDSFLHAINAAGSYDPTESRSYAVPVDLGFITACRKRIGAIDYCGRDIIEGESKFVDMLEESGATVIGKAPAFVPLGSSTSIVPVSDMGEGTKTFERRHEPAPMRPFIDADGNKVSPLKVRLAKMRATFEQKKKATFEVSALNRAVKKLRKFPISNAFVSYDDCSGKLVVDFNAAIRSSKDFGVKPVDRSRSAGASYLAQPKAIFMTDAEEPTLTDSALRVLEILLDDLQEGRTTQECVTAAFKDEVLVIDKCRLGGTRIFTPEGFFRFVLMRALFAPLLHAINAYGPELGIMTALTPVEMATHLSNKLKDLGLATDVAKQDYSHSGKSWDTFFYVLYEGGWLPPLGPEVVRNGCKLDLLNAVRLVLLKDLEHTYWWIGDAYTVSDSRLPSGCLLTFIFNCLIAFINNMHVEIWAESMGLPKLLFYMYGDDQLTILTKAAFKTWKTCGFCPISAVVKAHAGRGYKLTGSGQNGDFVIQEVSEMEFCGRTCCLTGAGHFSMGLTVPRWAKILQFCKRNKFSMDYPERLKTALEELANVDPRSAKRRFDDINWLGAVDFSSFLSFRELEKMNFGGPKVCRAISDFVTSRPSKFRGTAGTETEIPSAKEVEKQSIIEITTAMDVETTAVETKFADVDVSYHTDNTMAEIFARPVKVSSKTWALQAENDVLVQFSPLSEYFRASKNQRFKLSNNAIIAADVVIDLVMAPVAVARGALCCQCIPCGRRANSWEQALSARSSMVDVSRNTTVSMTVGYARELMGSAVQGYSIESGKWFDFCLFYAYVVVPYDTGTASDSMVVDCYVRLQNVRLAKGTPVDIGTGFEGDSISGASVPSAFQKAGKVAFTGGLEKIVAGGVSQMLPAVASKPLVVEPSQIYVPRPARNMSNSDGSSASVTSTLNFQAVPVPRPEIDDAMSPVDSIAVLAAREGYILDTDFDSTTVANTVLAVVPLTPAIETSASGVYPPMTFAAGMHKWWYGDLVYRFRFFSSVFTNYVVRVTAVFDFVASTGAMNDDTRSVCFSQIVSLTGMREFQVEVPYFRPYPLDSCIQQTVNDSSAVYPKMIVELVSKVTTSGISSDSVKMVITGCLVNSRFSWPIDSLQVSKQDFQDTNGSFTPPTSSSSSRPVRLKRVRKINRACCSCGGEGVQLSRNRVRALFKGTADEQEGSSVFAESTVSDHPKYVLGEQRSFDPIKATAYFHGGDVSSSIISLLYRSRQITNVTTGNALFSRNLDDLPPGWRLLMSTAVFATGTFKIVAMGQAPGNFVTYGVSNSAYTEGEPVNFWPANPSALIEIQTAHQSPYQNWVVKDLENQLPMDVVVQTFLGEELIVALSVSDGFKLNYPDVLPLALWQDVLSGVPAPFQIQVLDV